MWDFTEYRWKEKKKKEKEETKGVTEDDVSPTRSEETIKFVYSRVSPETNQSGFTFRRDNSSRRPFSTSICTLYYHTWVCRFSVPWPLPEEFPLTLQAWSFVLYLVIGFVRFDFNGVFWVTQTKRWDDQHQKIRKIKCQHF